MAAAPLSASEIEAIYETKILVNREEAYLDRYSDYDFEAAFGPDMLRRLEFPRLIIVLEFARLVAERGISSEHVLMVNGGESGDPELAYLPHGHVESIDFESDPQRHDLHTLDLEPTPRDFALLSQTIEHLYDPLLGLRNLYGAVSDGAYLWASVPTISMQHQMPFHFTTGCTPIGLACLCRQAGFEVLEIGQWGNTKYIEHLFDLDIIPTYYDLARLSLRARGFGHVRRTLTRLSVRNSWVDGARRNEFDHPVQTWALARKSANA
jgi:hypothetical protein